MFTGLIEYQGKVAKWQPLDSTAKIWIESKELSPLVELGGSVAVSGVCLTLVNKDDSLMEFDLSQETLSRSNFESLQTGQRLNLEPALRANQSLGGHLVQGHVDGCAELISVKEQDAHYELVLQFPDELYDYLVDKASICLNGVSLTLNECLKNNQASFNIVPHTWAQTDIHSWQPGQKLNVEIDILAKYVLKYSQKMPERILQL